MLKRHSIKKEKNCKRALFAKHKDRMRRKWMIMLLLCILMALFFLDGEAYAHCNSIFPDEIMDLHGHLPSEMEKPILSENRSEQESQYCIERYTPSPFVVCLAKRCFFINFYHLYDHQKRLFTFQRYNS